ncbi:hypothetical protein BpHYR1_024238 [Brachionus plicatilis]|uniref:Uncharacterized protein n=1 Tax=Brachionus plicatilis TaxID=10195 RepID=A0A3M7R9I0_BRAPC|nr:hypothetical protein BpHYR1_024238 [Brachionus plicatilis]
MGLLKFAEINSWIFSNHKYHNISRKPMEGTVTEPKGICFRDSDEDELLNRIVNFNIFELTSGRTEWN